MKAILKRTGNRTLLFLGMLALILCMSLPFLAAEWGGHTAANIVALVNTIGIVGAIIWKFGS